MAALDTLKKFVMTQSDEKTQEFNSTDLTLPLGHEELVIRRRYQFVSILNDFLLGLAFLVGSIFFLFDPLQTAGVWLFIIGSFLFVMRPAIRVTHYLHLGRRPTGQWDY